ncbi:acyl-CoA dehydrogenase family protein [Rhodoligotrophos defluvii]|uniref:acyl-CoA dehydrogenase family protein n=1 Tax=Rhodoligotrophos defluvii TaxID=2561934 RepID=UPI0010C9F1EE|nr:acyl-CoA dehydrogenase [Rhodoligotrophos defluvii]
MDFAVSDQIKAIADGLLRFVDQVVVPLEVEHAAIFSNNRMIFEADGRYSDRVLELRRQVRTKSAEAGYYTMLGAEELGGGGLGAVAAVWVQMQLARRYGPERHLIHHVVVPSPFTNGLSPVLRHLDKGLKERYLPGIASGEKTLCFALSEPDAGSDAQAIRTRADRDGDDWVITGTKQWITNSPYADYAVVFAVTDREQAEGRKGGVTAFFVDTATPGFKVTAVIPLMGQAGGDTGIIALDRVRVPDRNRLGEAGQGLTVAMQGINAGRLGMAATCVGYAEWALAMASDYAGTRRTFGRPIGEHQAIQHHLADMAMDVFAAKSMLLNCAARIDAGLPARGEIAMVKCFATEMLSRCMDRAIQVHGAMGLTNELRLEAGYRFARIMRIPDGTAEMQRRTVATELLRGRLEI